MRPAGDPFRRTICAAPELVREWAEDRGAAIAIADEGPGMSGSSFGAVIDALEDAGVPLARIECYPSHLGDLGPAALPRHRERWARLPRHAADCDELLVRSGRLAGWIEELVGPLAGPLEDLSAGAWRARRYPCEPAWPPAIVHQERRKLLARAGDGSCWLARFAGLGADGERAWALARTLHGGGFTPEPRGLVHGFLIERWLDDARPLEVRAVDRWMLVEHVGRYLACRARLPAGGTGAPLAALLAMARRNAGLALGDDAARSLDRWAPCLPALERRSRRVPIDGRLHAWEWLVRGDGRLVKADA